MQVSWTRRYARVQETCPNSDVGSFDALPLAIPKPAYRALGVGGDNRPVPGYANGRTVPLLKVLRASRIMGGRHALAASGGPAISASRRFRYRRNIPKAAVARWRVERLAEGASYVRS